MRKLKRRKFKKKVVRYRWNEHHIKISKDNQIILRQVANQDNFELSIMHNGYQWHTIRMTRDDVEQAYKIMQKLFIELNKQDRIHELDNMIKKGRIK